MKRRTALSLPALALVLAGGPALLAQVTTGALSGRVFGEGGKPLANARITLESSALFQAKTYRTDATGTYRAQLLPVGNYTIKVSADGYLGRAAQGVRVGLGTNLTYDFPLRAIKEQGAVVEVVAKLVQESKTDDKVATNFSAEELTKLPTDRSFSGAAQLAPGITGGGDGAFNIRGGSTAGQSNRGGGYEQVNFTVDGIDVKDDTGSGSRHTIFEPLPDTIEDVQIVQSQLNARYGRTTGGALNIATKTGSNTFEGTLREFVNRPSWTTNLPHGSSGGLAASEAGLGQGYSHYTDVTFGGPIIKDRLWFFLGTRFQPTAAGSARLGWGSPAVMQQLGEDGTWSNLPGNWETYMKYPEITWGLYPNVDNVLRGGADTSGATVPGYAAYPTGFGPVDLTKSDNGAIIPTSSKYTHFQGKLTGLISTDNTITLTYLYGKTVNSGMTGQFASGLGEAINKAFTGDGVTDTKAYTLSWASTLASNWFLEARVAKAELDQHDVQGPTTYPVFVFSLLSSGDANKRLYAADDPQNFAGSGGRSAYFGPFDTLRMSSSYTPSIVENLTYTLNLKTFQDLKGQHEIDFGGEFFQTQNQFGRERNQNYGVMEGGFIRDNAKSALDASGYLFPVFYTSDASPLIPGGAYGPDDNLTLWQQAIYGPSAHIEQYNVLGSRSHNNSSALWLNDTWTLNDKWNVMIGLRYNRFLVHDTNGKTQCDNNITEPRFQVKFNPDGHNAEVISFTAAKLASRYSDDFASFFRTNGWFSRNVRAWSGAGYSARNPGNAQPAVDALNGSSDNGQYGVRWVTYNELISLDNYNTTPESVVALDQTMQTRGLQVPYVLEATLGYTRNYDSGSLKVNLVSRTFRKDWVSGVHEGMYDPADPYKYLTLVKNPVNGQPFSWNQTQLFMNSDQHRDYQGIEISWKDQLTSHLQFGGNFTYAVEHGMSGELDYYNFREEKLGLPLDPKTWGPTDALLSRSHMLNVHFTYEVPVGKGNVSASILAKLYNNGQRTLAGGNAMWDSVNPYSSLPYNSGGTTVNLPVFAIDSVASANGSASPRYNTYYGDLNGFTTNYADNLDIGLKLQGQFPLMGKLMLLAEIMIDNPFNRIARNRIYDWGGDTAGDWTGESVPIVGRPLGQFNHPWGYAGDSSYYSGGRTWTFNIALKF